MADEKKPARERLSALWAAFLKGDWTKRFRISYQVFWNIALIFIILVVLGGSFAGGVGAGYFASLVEDTEILPYEEMDKSIHDYTETSEFYFANDVYLGKLRTDLEREEVELENVSPFLIDAVIATEDEYFMEHEGVVPKAILRATYQEFTNAAVQTGGSTLTQQLIKNQILTNEVSFDRKAKEILLALRLERFFEKDEILEAYLNMADLGRNSSGRNIAGVETAAEGIFGTTAKDLTLPQAAFIAGLPQAPFAYTPYMNTGERKDEAGLQPGIERMQEVLFRMHREGTITQEQYDEALAYDITQDFMSRTPSGTEQYPYVTDELERRAIEILTFVLAEKDGHSKQQVMDSQSLMERYTELADREIRQSGYQIHSTIDKEMYDLMEQVKQDYDDFGPDKWVEETDPDTGEIVQVPYPVQVGGMLLENNTGKIISFVGGRDFQKEQLNHATRSYRSTGSTIKPLAVYAPAIEYGMIGAGSPLADIKFTLTIPGQPAWQPNNYTLREYGLVPARTALAASHNLSAARLYGKMLSEGRTPGEFLMRTSPERISAGEFERPAMSLGGQDEGLTVEENTAAYAALGNMGTYVEPYMVEKIVDRNGEVVYEHQTEEVEMFSPSTAYITLDMMRDTLLPVGTGRSLPNYINFSTDWAAKSGTSQDFHDNWFIATNPNITFGMWFGYDQPSSLYDNGNYNLRTIKLWAQMMNSARDLNPEMIDPERTFSQPEGVVNRSFCSFTGQEPTKACSDAGLVKSDLFPSSFAFQSSDDAIEATRVVTRNGERFIALDSTPEEFTETGGTLGTDIEDLLLSPFGGDISKLFPEGNDFFDNLLVADQELKDDGSAPSGVNASTSGSSINWSHSGSSDVVGYRVYKKDGGKAATIQYDDDLTYNASDGTYYVVAVDVAGRESSPSADMTIGEADKPEENSEPAEETTEESTEAPAEETSEEPAEEATGEEPAEEAAEEQPAEETSEEAAEEAPADEETDAPAEEETSEEESP